MGVAVKVLAADVLARLTGIEERGGNLSGVMRDFGEYMRGSIQRNFDAEGRPTKWRPLAWVTKAGWILGRRSAWTKKGKMSKPGRAAWSGRKALTDTARLRRSISYVAGAMSLILGTNVIYAAIHQFGGMAGRGRQVLIPARPYLLFQEEDLHYFERAALNFVLAGRR